MTAQLHENLILDGEQTSMAFCPPLPKGHPRVVELFTDEEFATLYRSARKTEEENRTLKLLSSFISTACWRRYQGTWEVRDGQFFLVGIEGLFKLLGEEPLLADWFTGVLRIPRGEMLTYVHMGFGCVENGRVTGTRIYDNRGKNFDEWQLGWENLPGGENRFPGDGDFGNP